LGDLPGSYQGSQYSQFAGPDQQQTTAMQNSLMQAILGNPETLGPQQLAQLKEKQKEAALMQEQQGLALAQQFAAQRGTTNGAALAGLLSQIRGETGNSIITGNRDLDLAAMQQNRADQLAALGMSDSLMSGQMSRASQGFQNTLAGQSAQAQDTRSVAQDAISRAITGHDANLASAGMGLQKEGMQADENFRQFGTERSAQDADLQRILQQFGVNSGVRDSHRADEALALNRELGHGGLSIDQQRLAQQGSQFDQSFGLDVLGFLDGQSRHADNLGLSYNQLNTQGQNNTINQILSILGGR